MMRDTATRITSGLILAAVLTLAAAWASNDTYTSAEAEARIAPIEREMDLLRQDVRWLVRNAGGEPAEVTDATVRGE